MLSGELKDLAVLMLGVLERALFLEALLSPFVSSRPSKLRTKALTKALEFLKEGGTNRRNFFPP